LWRKRTTVQNIVIGGAAGAIPPLVGWAAVANNVDLPALYLFAIIFFWTPAHFWPLALLIRDDYDRAGVPLLPVVHGERAAQWGILLYATALVPLSAPLFLLGLAALVAALASPIDSIALQLFSIHMVQHMLLLAVAAQLLLAGAPVRPLLRGLPIAVRRTAVRAVARNIAFRSLVHVLRQPLVAAGLYIVGLY